MKCNVYKVSVGYYVSLVFGKNHPHRYNDHDISEFCKMSITKYRNTLVKQFNGHRVKLWGNEVFFDTENDVRKAAEWIESIALSNTLGGVENE
jgi:hypothetical protein